MLFPRETVGKFHDEDALPPFPCPNCLQNIKANMKECRYVPTRQSSFLYDIGAIDPDGLTGHFHLELQCTNAVCGERVIAVGDFIIEEDKDHPDFQNQHFKNKLRFFHFYPSLPVFRMPEGTPSMIQDGLRRAFSHAFSDASVTGNSLRRVVERILDHLKVGKTRMGTKRRVRLTLHDRIIRWQPNSNGLADYLMAIKWIGNDASHEDEVSFDSVYNAFEIIETVVERLFSGDDRRIGKLVTKIVKQKARKP